MEICENPSCKVWLHEECLIDDILTKTYNKLVTEKRSEEPDTNGTAKANGKKSKGKIWKGKFQAKLNSDDGRTTATITDMRNTGTGPRTWTERVACLKCDTLLE